MSCSDPESMDWQGDAACRGEDPRLFEVLSGDECAHLGGYVLNHARIQRARRFCRESGCPVRAACLEWGTRNEMVGVWGGEYLSREFHQIRRRGRA